MVYSQVKGDEISMNTQKEYYTATEAIEKLGIGRSGFYDRVNAGQIQKVTLPGRKQGVYVARDVDTLAEVLSAAFSVKPDRIVFSRSTAGDQKEEMELGIRCFGEEYITPLRERIEFQEKSEYTFWSLKVNNRVAGYISMFRFPPEFLDDILTGRHIERDITVREVLRFKRLEPFDVYIDVMAMDPRLSAHERHLYAGILVSRFANVILDLINNGYQIQRLYTVTATPEGDNLVNHIGFQLMPGKSLAPGRVAYVFPLDEQGIERLKERARASRKGVF